MKKKNIKIKPVPAQEKQGQEVPHRTADGNSGGGSVRTGLRSGQAAGGVLL